MNTPSFESTRQLGQLEFMSGLVSANNVVAGDIVQIGDATWGIHGSFPVDGEVLVAEYPSFEEASAALAALAPNVVPDAQAQPATRQASRSGPPAGAPTYFLGRDA